MHEKQIMEQAKEMLGRGENDLTTMLRVLMLLLEKVANIKAVSSTK